ncbi:MAG: hypothetical protein JSW54_08725 [Fidelibacterota bacterium]|nr:MAG: hypothetical protein JSW54_08725 [Candidatus Neomarinimicrobiota bacterium]
MTSDTVRRKVIDRILESEEFCNSSTYAQYLEYLFESTRKGTAPKETTIAIEFFGKGPDFNPAEDTIVRSHTYQLRKKLERYYFTEGKNDKCQVVIPKGHYEVSFIQRSEGITSPKFLLQYIRKHYAAFTILALAVGIAALLIYNQSIRAQLDRYALIEPDDFIWKEYIHSELPILVVPGDHFMFNVHSNEYDSDFSIRDITINSLEDLENLRARYPDRSIIPADEPYFPYHSIWSLPPVLSLLFSVNQQPILRKSSDIIPQILDEYNIIFTGSIKTLYTLKYTLASSHFDFEITPHRVIYTPPDSTERQIFETNLHSPGPNEDLVLALKLPGPADNAILIIASYSSLGAPEISNYLTKPKTRVQLAQLFQEKYGSTPDYFEILFRVVGIDKTAYDTEILIYNEITRN